MRQGHSATTCAIAPTTKPSTSISKARARSGAGSSSTASYRLLLGSIVLTHCLRPLPRLLRKQVTRSSAPPSLFRNTQPRHQLWIQLEASPCSLHGSLMAIFSVPSFTTSPSCSLWIHLVRDAVRPPLRYPRDVLRGAAISRRSGRSIALVNHNWHLNHHLNPTVPWIHLPRLAAESPDDKRSSLVWAYLRMWRGRASMTNASRTVSPGESSSDRNSEPPRRIEAGLFRTSTRLDVAVEFPFRSPTFVMLSIALANLPAGLESPVS